MKTLSAPAHRLTAVGVIAAQAAAALYMALAGPTHPIPMHFDGSGAVNHWGDRREAAGFLLLMCAVSVITTLALGPLSRRRDVDPSGNNLRAGQALSLAITSGLCVLMYVLAFAHIPTNAGAAMGQGIMSAVYLLIGAYLGKVGPNLLVGVKTPWNFASRLAWDKSNRLAGRLFFWGGLIGLVATPFTPQPLGLHALIAFTVFSVVAVVFESWRVWRNDPERTPAF